METTSQPSTFTTSKSKVNWSHVGWYLGLAFGLAWLVDLVVYLNGGLASPGITLLLQFQMLMPAFSAMVLGVFFFKESPINHRTNHTSSRWFVYFYLLMTLFYFAGAVVVLVRPEQLTTISSLLLLLSVIGLVLLIVLRLLKGGKEAFAGAGLAGGKWQVWVVYGLGVVAFYGLQTLLNYVFKMGHVVDIKETLPQMAAANLPDLVTKLLASVSFILVGPLLGLIISFGEEYGWRGYLQTELIRLGRVRGVLLLGVIWGIWHWPMIWMGYNYPGQPIIGSLAMVAVCIILSFFLAHAVFKSNGVWTAAYLHAINNQSLSYFIMVMVMPASMLFSFGIGIPSLVLGAIIVLLLLRDPVWKVTE
jgi:membrane protease YdiL (CAAX protease family)